MAANFKITRRFNGSMSELFKKCRSALKVSGFKIKDEDEYSGTLIANAGINFWSWGEKITIKISKLGDVQAKSECVMPTQVTSWGKNKRNVEKFLQNLQAIIN